MPSVVGGFGTWVAISPEDSALDGFSRGPGAWKRRYPK
jgi:hypothetical protein